MGKATIQLNCEDNASRVIDQVASRLGIFSKQGIAMGISFAAVNKVMDLTGQAINGLIDYIQKGIEMNRQFDLSITRLALSAKDLDIPIATLKTTLLSFSALFAEDIGNVTKGLQDYIRNGFSASDATRLLYTSEQLAVTSNNDLETTIGAVNTALEVFNLDADSAGYITKKFNEIVSLTDLSLGDIDRILSQCAEGIHENAMNFNDLTNILYTFDSQGYSSKSIILGIKDALNNWPDVEVKIPDVSNIETVEEKYKKIGDTFAFTAEQVNELNKARQIRISGGMDLTGVMDRSIITEAYELIQARKNNDEEFLRHFELEAEQWATGTRMEEIRSYANAIEEANYQQQQLKDSSPAGTLKDLSNQMIGLTANLTKYTDAWKTNKTNIVDWGEQQGKLTTVHTLNEDLRYMAMGLIDASYSSKIHNDATRSLIDSIRLQEDEINNLNKISKQYSMQENANTLETMKIQYAAMDQRRGLNRGQEQQLKELDKANMGLRINTIENQMKIDQAQMNLDPLHQRLEQTKMWYNEELYTIQDTYNAEMKALEEKIRLENDLMQENYNNIATYNNKVIQNELDAYDARLRIWEKEHNYTWGAHVGEVGMAPPGVPAPPGYGQSYVITAPEIYNRSPLPKLDTGGDIIRSGIAYVSAGERVLPAGKSGDIHITNNIKVNGNLSSKIDTNALCDAICRATKEGLCKTNITKFNSR